MVLAYLIRIWHICLYKFSVGAFIIAHIIPHFCNLLCYEEKRRTKSNLVLLVICVHEICSYSNSSY